MGRGSRHKSKVGLLGDAGGGWRYAAKKMGAHHQFVLGRRTDGRGSRGALRGIQGRDHRADPFLRLVICSRRDYSERHRTCVDRDGHGDQQPECKSRSDSDGAFWLSGRCRIGGCDAGDE